MKKINIINNCAHLAVLSVHVVVEMLEERRDVL